MVDGPGVGEIVDVAGCASRREPGVLRGPGAFVAGLAIHRRMRAHQRESRGMLSHGLGLTSHPFTLWQSSHLAPNCRRWMSAWQSAQCVDASRKIMLAWHWRHSTLLCIPLSGYVVYRLWLNSGTAR